MKINMIKDEYIPIQGPLDTNGEHQTLYVHKDTISEQSKAYGEIARKAEEAGLIAGAYAGYILIFHPELQIAENAYYDIQKITGNAQRCKEGIFS